MVRTRTCPDFQVFFSMQCSLRVTLTICLLVAFHGLDNGTEAFSARSPSVITVRKPVLCGTRLSTPTLTSSVCGGEHKKRNLRSATLRLHMQGRDSWLDRAIDRLVGDGGYDPSLSGEATDDGTSGYFVILEDDSQHTVDEVVKILRKIVGCSWKDSLDTTLEVDRRGWSIVKEGGEQECNLLRDALCSATLKASVLDEDAVERKREETVEDKEPVTETKSMFVLTSAEGILGCSPAGPMVTLAKRQVREMMRFCKGEVDFVVAGRNEKAANKLLKQLAGGLFFFGGREWATMRTQHQGSAEFQAVELDDFPSLVAAIQQSDLVIHTAGPFQGALPEVLRAAIACGTPYMDVCDDVEYARRCRQMSPDALAEGVTAVTTCGIYPGLSNVMAARAVRQLEEEGGVEAERVEFSYFTAGTGGVGATILASTFLLLAEKCEVFRGGAREELEPLSVERDVDFGERVGGHRVMLLNLPEVVTAHEVLGVPNVNAAFATAPKFWNTLLKVLVKVLPRKLLANRDLANAFAKVSLPANRVVDALVGSAAGIRVDVSGGGKTTSSLWTGKYLSQAVGVATAAMAMEMLESDMPAGVLFPEEAVVAQRTEAFLDRACKGAMDLELPSRADVQSKE